MHEVLGKNKATTVVTIDEVDTDNWGIGGVPVTEIRKKRILQNSEVKKHKVFLKIKKDFTPSNANK